MVIKKAFVIVSGWCFAANDTA